MGFQGWCEPEPRPGDSSSVHDSVVPSSPFTESREDVLSPVLGEGEAHRLQWTAAGPTGTLRGRTRGELARLETGDRAQEELMELIEELRLVFGPTELAPSWRHEAESIYETAILFKLEAPGANFPYSSEVCGILSECFCVSHEFSCDLAFSAGADFGHANDIEKPPVRFLDVLGLVHENAWHGAMKTELEGLEKLQAWSYPEKVPASANVVNARCVYAWKNDEEGFVTKPKARLVPRGFSQRYKDTFDQTFAATPAAASTKTVAVVGVEKGWVIHQLDVRQAYIGADIDFQMFIKLPEGCGDKSGKVVRLNKGVYGLRQGAFLWSKHFGGGLIGRVGLEQCKA